MIRSLFLRLIAPAVISDVDRLIENHEGAAVFLVRHILSVNHGGRAEHHWRRVLAEIERRDRYKPQRR